MALGSTMGGMALACARLGLVHGLAHPIGHVWALPHGFVCGMLMPAVMEFNLPVAAGKYAAAAKAIGVGDDAEELVAWFKALAAEVGMKRPAAIDAKPMTAEEEQLIVEQTLASGSTKHNPRTAEEGDVRAMLREVVGAR
jgi:alcohol dehydrogenase